MNKQQTKAFTLVELIVVITILAILWTIAFISLQWYSADSRDSVRISDVSNIKTSLELFHLNAWKYPLPDNAETVTYSGGILWYQGTVGEQVVSNISRNMSEVPKDPLMDKEYFYSVHNNKNQLQVLALLEGDIAALNNLDSVYAGNLSVTPRLDGNYNWLFVKTKTHLVPIPSIMTAINIPGTMELTQDNISSQITHLGDNIPEIWNVASNTGGITGIHLSVWTWSLTSDSSDSDKVAAMEAIKMAYSGSGLENQWLIATVLETSGTWAVTAMIDSVVLGNSTSVVTVSASSNDNPVTIVQTVDNTNCATILASWWAWSWSTIYTIDPDWDWWNTAFNVYCDMTTDGGWWTLITNVIADSPTEDFVWWNLNQNFIFPFTEINALKALSNTIRYNCENTWTIIDIKNSNSLWLDRPSQIWDGCAQWYNWNPGTSWFTQIWNHNYTFRNQSNVSCSSREGHRLNTYPIWYFYDDFFILDRYYGNRWRVCWWKSKSEFMRVWYR